MSVMRDSHRPTENNVFGGGVRRGDAFDLILGNARLFAYFVPIESREPVFDRGPIVAMELEKVFIRSV